MTLTGAADNGNFRWIREKPAPTIVGSFAPDRVRRAGDVSRQDDPEAVSITLEEAAIFPPDFPFQGTKGEKFEQIGNAIPPLFARRLLESLIRP